MLQCGSVYYGINFSFGSVFDQVEMIFLDHMVWVFRYVYEITCIVGLFSALI